MRTSFITLLFVCMFLTSCGHYAPSGSSVFQMRLVQDSATTETEPLTIVHSLTDVTRTTPETLNVRKEVLLDRGAVSSATVQKPSPSGAAMIEVVMTDEGRKVLADITRKNVGKRLAIVVDGQLLAAPRIEAEIPGGSALITGRFSSREASELASKINDGLKK